MVHPSLLLLVSLSHETSLALFGASVALSFLQSTVPQLCVLVFKLNTGVVKSEKKWCPLRKRLAGESTFVGSGTGKRSAIPGMTERSCGYGPARQVTLNRVATAPVADG